MRIFSGTLKGRRLKSTSGPGFRPAMGKVREALFSMLDAQGFSWPQASVLDLFAGSGSLGFEALSHGAARVCFVDSAQYAAKIIAANAALLQVEERVRILRTEAEILLRKKAPEAYDLVFIDPPYSMHVLPKALKNLMSQGWVKANSIINAEIEARQKYGIDLSHPGLELISNREYGQTRVLLWKAHLPSPSIPAPLTR